MYTIYFNDDPEHGWNRRFKALLDAELYLRRMFKHASIRGYSMENGGEIVKSAWKGYR